MKKLVIAVLAGLALNVTHAAGYGVIDLERVVQNSSYLKQQNTSLQNTIKPQTSQLEQLQKI